MSNSKPRVHKNLDVETYRPRGNSAPPRTWDMRYDPRERWGVFREPRFPYHYNYYGPRTTAVMPRVERLCILFRYHHSVKSNWTFDIMHMGPPSGADGYAVTAEDVVGGIYEQLRIEASDEERSHSREHNALAEQARVERCRLFGLNMSWEPLRRIDYVKGVLGFCAFGGLEGYSRHLCTPRLRLLLINVDIEA